MRKLRLRYPTTCRVCGVDLAAGTSVAWDREAKRASCLDGRHATPDADPTAGPVESPPERGAATAGASAEREYERRRDAREQRVRARYPRLGGMMLAIAGEPQHQRAWKQGAAGERAVAERLAQLEPDGVLALHDRRIPGSRANIDHVSVSAAGVFVIDAKRWSGKVEVRDVSRLFEPADERLYAAGRDRSKAIDGLVRQITVVRSMLDGLPPVPVRGILAITGAQFPLLDLRGFELDGIRIGNLEHMVRLLRTDGALTEPARRALLDRLSERLPPAASTSGT